MQNASKHIPNMILSECAMTLVNSNTFFSFTDCPSITDSCVLFYSIEPVQRGPGVFKMIGGIIGLIFVVGFFAICVCVCRRRRASRTRFATTTTTVINNIPNAARGYAAPPANVGGVSNVPMVHGHPQYPYPQQPPHMAPPVAPSMQPYPPYAGASMPQPATNPAFAGDYTQQTVFDPPPPYNTSVQATAPQ